MKSFLRFVIKRCWIFLLLIVPTGQTIAQSQEWSKYSVREDLTTQELIEEMGLGINIGNTLEASGDWFPQNNILNFEKCWGAPETTEKIIAGYAAAGFKSLRIPVRWTNMMVLSTNTVHASLLDRVEKIVNWTIDNGMVAMINSHHMDFLWDYDYPETRDEYRERFSAIWQQVSERFEKYGDRLLFEPMNEIGFDRIWTPWMGGTSAQKREAKAKAFGLVNELNQIFVDVVRASGGNNAKRHLVIEVYNTNDAYAYDPNFKMPIDPANRCAATVHYYTPACFAIADGPTSWCPNGQATPTWGTDADWKELNDNMDNLKKNCVDKGIPIIVGEYAACGGNKTQDMRRLYAVSVTEAVYSRGMCPMVWDTPGDQYNRSNRTWRDPLFVEEFQAISAKYSKPTAIKENNISPESAPDIYPNPAKDIVNIQFMQESLKRWELFDAQMRLLAKQQVSGHSVQVDVSALSGGIYFLRITTESKSYVRQVIIQ